MRRALSLAALLLLTLAPVAASAATRYVIAGAGFGHGIGMSQYGAYGYARHGYDYRQILAHYYAGTTIGRVPGRRIRVLLEGGRRRITAVATVRDPRSGRTRTITYVATAHGGGVELRDGHGRLLGDYSGAVSVTSLSGAVRLGGVAANGVADGRYRGSIEIVPTGGALDAVNALALDSYVQGVVPGEVEASWPRAALEAQAVAARSYALATHAGGSIFDQYADTRSQMFKGLSGEQASTNAAVRATAGEVVSYRGTVATTYFFSTSGGHTENVENVFYGSRPLAYLRGVADPYDYYAPEHRWRLTLTRSQLDARLGSLCRGRFERLGAVRRGVSPRIVSARVVCTNGATRTSGVRLRAALGLRDTWFTITRVSAHPAHGAYAPTLLARLVAPPLALAGQFDPAPAGDLLSVERLAGRRWVAAGSVRTSPAGDYAYAVDAPGVYRVRSGDTVGPAARVA